MPRRRHSPIHGQSGKYHRVSRNRYQAKGSDSELDAVDDSEDLSLIAKASADGNAEWLEAASVALGASLSGATRDIGIWEWMSSVSGAQHSAEIIQQARSISPSRILLDPPVSVNK